MGTIHNIKKINKQLDKIETIFNDWLEVEIKGKPLTRKQIEHLVYIEIQAEKENIKGVSNLLKKIRRIKKNETKN